MEVSGDNLRALAWVLFKKPPLIHTLQAQNGC